jgi:RHS repeat-associated protein
MPTRRNSLSRLLIVSCLLTATTVGHAAIEQITCCHLDALGSPVAASDATGNYYLWKETYQPYGERIQKQPASANNNRWYTGKPLDEETGLSYFGARYYDPVIGRFMGVDPKEFAEGNPHSFNRYNYANNNPYRYVDPDGQVPVETVLDAGFVIYDFGRFLGAGAAYLHGALSGNPALMAEGRAGLTETGTALGGSLTGLAVPYAPAAVTRGVGRGIGEIVKEEVRHKGFIESLGRMKGASLQKTIRSLDRNIKDHLDKIKNNPGSRDAPHWQKEITTFTEQRDLARKELVKRGLE